MDPALVLIIYQLLLHCLAYTHFVCFFRNRSLFKFCASLVAYLFPIFRFFTWLYWCCAHVYMNILFLSETVKFVLISNIRVCIRLSDFTYDLLVIYAATCFLLNLYCFLIQITMMQIGVLRSILQLWWGRLLENGLRPYFGERNPPNLTLKEEIFW